MNPEAYCRWRQQLWSQRGPNVATPTYEALLPCYKEAIERCSQLSLDRPEQQNKSSACSKEQASVASMASVEATVKSPARKELLDAMLRAVNSGAEEPFYVIDLDAAVERLALWHELLPDIEPHYAVKCNSDPALLLTLAHAGTSFDCASRAEISQVLELGVPASRILYANPIKQPSHLRFAAERGVSLTVFDGEHELAKLAQCHPSCKLLLRIAVDDSQAQCVLSNKYGAQPRDAEHLLDAAARNGLHVVGISFHVGSGSSSVDAFRDAVKRAARIFDAAAERGSPMTVLDVGGGFPGVDTEEVSFHAMAVALRDALKVHFPRDRGVRIIAEPGRFFASPTHTLATSIIGKKVAGSTLAENAESDEALADTGATLRVNYYNNDGLYGSFNCILYDHASPSFEVLPTPSVVDTITNEATACVWGPTCDGIDCVVADARLPALPVGAWLYFQDMGAYTACAGSNFNGMALPDVVYLQAKSDDAKRPQPPRIAAATMLRQLAEDGVTAVPVKPSSAALENNAYKV